MKITSDLFQAFLRCPTKCWLRAAGEPGSGNAYAEWVKSQTASYVATQTARLLSEAAKDESAVSPALEEFKGGEWRLATSMVVQAELNSYTLESKLHAIERMPPEGRGRPAKFVPMRFIFTNKLGKDDKLLLAFDAVVLSEAAGRAISISKIIHGDDCVTVKVKTPALAGAVRKHVERIAAMLSSPTPPDLVLNRHCTECEFQARCRQRAIEKDDLSLLNSLSSQERTEFNGKGIFTVTQLSHTFRPRRRPKGLKLRRERYHHSLKALAIRQNKIHIVGSPEFKVEGTPVYVDVEGLPDHDFYYLIGLRVGTGESATRHTMWANAVEGEGKIWHEFLGILGTIEKPVLVHYGSYEKAFFNSMSERHGKPPEGSVVAEAVRTSMNLLSVIFAQIYFPTYSNGLKDVARWLGFTWSAEDASGIQSIMWRNEWEQTKAPLPKEKLIAYNSEDCAALEVVARIVLQSCQRIEKPSSDPADRLEVVVADTLDSKLTMWPKFNSSIEGFEAINKAARWDYQRDRIYVRTDGELKRIKQKKMKRRAKRPTPVSKVVVCERPASCLRCQKKGGLMLRTITKRLHNLRFTRSGINGWVKGVDVFRSVLHRGTVYSQTCHTHWHYPPADICWSSRTIRQSRSSI